MVESKAVLVALATYRVTRFLTRDHFPPIVAARQRVTDRFGEDSAWAFLVQCPWCISVYVGAVLTAATRRWAGLACPWLVWPAASAVTGLLSAREEPRGSEEE